MVACFLLENIGIFCERQRHPHLSDASCALHDDGRLTAVSSEASAQGVRVGQTLSSARSLCRTITLLPCDQACYEQMACQVWDCYAEETSTVEPVSHECAFLELAAHDHASRAEALLQQINERFGLTIQAGIGRTKLIALHAARSAEALHVLSVLPPADTLFLAQVRLTALSVLTPKEIEQLERLGIRTLGQAQAIPIPQAPKHLRPVIAKLHQLAQGFDGNPVAAIWPRRSVTASVTFDEELCLWPVIDAHIVALADQVARDLSHPTTFCRQVRLTVGLGSQSLTQEERIPPTNDARMLSGVGTRLLQRMKVACPIQSLTLTADHIGAGASVQPLLFAFERGSLVVPEEQTALKAVRTRLAGRFGSNAVLTASAFHQERHTHLWTYPLTRSLHVPVCVATDHDGIPTSFSWRRGTLAVHAVHDRWIEEQSAPESMESVYRVTTDRLGLVELHERGEAWWVGGIAD